MEEEPGKAEELWPMKGHSDPGWLSLSQGQGSNVWPQEVLGACESG